MPKSNSRQTAYEHNSVSHAREPDYQDYCWSETINRMIGKRYSFLPEQYQAEGYLFRGMSQGLLNAVLHDCFWHFESDMHVATFEQEENMLCVSQDFSDAYTVSRLWEQNPESCILIIKSQLFNDCLQERTAAMLATAEPGVVFRYPFFTSPLRFTDVHQIVISPLLLTAMKNDKLPEINNDIAPDEIGLIKNRLQQLAGSNRLLACSEIYERKILEKELTDILTEQGVTGADIIKSGQMPSRS